MSLVPLNNPTNKSQAIRPVSNKVNSSSNEASAPENISEDFLHSPGPYKQAPENTSVESVFSSTQRTKIALERSQSSSWSHQGAQAFGGAGAGSTAGSSQLASSMSLLDEASKDPFGLANSVNSSNSPNSPNGADIKLPASAIIPNPSEITSKTDSLVPNPSNVPLTEMEFEVIRLTNAARQEKGLPPLEARANLTETARESSAKMRAISSMEHGLTSGWGRENIAMGQNSASEVVRAWLNSPGHYANIMSNSSYIGVGDTSGDGGAPYWTMQLS